jgi:hypothetical protein
MFSDIGIDEARGFAHFLADLGLFGFLERGDQGRLGDAGDVDAVGGGPGDEIGVQCDADGFPLGAVVVEGYARDSVSRIKRPV